MSADDANLDALIARLNDSDDRLCPFDGPINLQPEPSDPCPVCGDLGDISNDPSKCVGNGQHLLRREAAAALADAQRKIEARELALDEACRQLANIQQAEVVRAARTQQAEAERDTWRNECLLTAAHQGIDNYQRMIDRATAAEAKVAALREQVQALTAVPREPTDAMLHVGLDIWQRTYPGFNIDRLGDIWSAMYDAARQPRAEDNNESTPWRDE